MSKNSFMKLDTRELDRILSQFSGISGEMDGAMSKALNRAIDSSKTALVNAVNADYTISKTTVRKTTSVKKSNASNLQGTIYSKGSSIPLLEFKVSPSTVNPNRRTPLKVSVKRGSNKTVPNIFIANDLNGNKRIFERSGKVHRPSVGNYAGKRREKLDAKYGPSVPFMAGNDDVADIIVARAGEQLQNRIDHEINRILGVKK